jgi:hypothetical protein
MGLHRIQRTIENKIVRDSRLSKFLVRKKTENSLSALSVLNLDLEIKRRGRPPPKVLCTEGRQRSLRVNASRLRRLKSYPVNAKHLYSAYCFFSNSLPPPFLPLRSWRPLRFKIFSAKNRFGCCTVCFTLNRKKLNNIKLM